MTKRQLINIADIFGFEVEYDGITDNQVPKLNFMNFKYIFDSNCIVTIHNSELTHPKDVIAGKFQKALIEKGRSWLAFEIRQLLNIN